MVFLGIIIMSSTSTFCGGTSLFNVSSTCSFSLFFLPSSSVMIRPCVYSWLFLNAVVYRCIFFVMSLKQFSSDHAFSATFWVPFARFPIHFLLSVLILALISLSLLCILPEVLYTLTFSYPFFPLFHACELIQGFLLLHLCSQNLPKNLTNS